MTIASCIKQEARSSLALARCELNLESYYYCLLEARNYATWTRADRADFDLWGKMVGDDRWSYNGQLPYILKTEHHHDSSADPSQHGFNGPIHTTPTTTCSYPLTEQVGEAYLAIGVKPVPDHNGGDNKGMSRHVENWYKGKRQPAGKA